MLVASGLVSRGLRYAPAALAIVFVTAIGAHLAQAQSTPISRRIQTDVELFANPTASAEDRDRAQADLLALIRTPGGQERLVVMFENPAFAVRAGNWLESVRPSAAQDRTNVCEVALGVLHNTTDGQLVMAMIHTVLRQVVTQIQDEPNINPLLLAARISKELKAEIDGAATRAKMSALRDIAQAMTNEQITAAQRQFLEQVTTLSSRRRGNPAGPKLTSAKTRP